jgi:hypothetical protein
MQLKDDIGSMQTEGLPFNNEPSNVELLIPNIDIIRTLVNNTN